MGMQKSVGEASVGMMMMMKKKKRREAKGERVESETVQTLYTSSEGARGWSDVSTRQTLGEGEGGKGQARGRRGRETTRPSNNKHRTTTRIT